MKYVMLCVTLSLLMFMPYQAHAASAQEIESKVNQALSELYQHSAAGKELATNAAGILVFPEVIKAGIGIGGEYGEGALRVGGKTVSYYNVASASIGFQLGAQIKAEVLLFMTADALAKFRHSDGWEAGVDGSVALATLGAGGTLDSNTLQQPIIGFIFSNKGLMYNLSIEGSKITKIQR
ncbi:YSC84-related protein [Amphritea sp. 2_MG-2023]|uniref:BPSL1445 family SYLF domain-containing lipoprotein n=1 Tax=Amphritea TaxID=515417 RepID=UPI00209171AD|nr:MULTISPECIES: YSC84-related protein [Amphritea]MDO6419541.1 YSC84-related protein [Amphritea sp. 2_MG-2023]MDX2422677.1 YSC84-related protein [Amphritea sp.]